MNRPQSPAYKKSRVIVGVVIAVASTLLTPLLAGLCTTVMGFTVLSTFLYAFGGIIPAAVSMLLNVAAFGILFDVPGALVACLGFTLPSAYIIRNLRWRIPFPKLAASAIGAQILGTLAALAAAYAFIGSDIIGALSGLIRDLLDMLPLGFTDYLLDMMYGIESVPETLTEIQLAEGILTAERRAMFLDAYVTDISANLRLVLPGELLAASCLTGVVASAWPAKLMDRRAPVTGAYIPMARWFTPMTISLGLLATFIVTWLLSLTGFKGGDAAQVTVQALLYLVLRIQAAVSVERRMKRQNMHPALRVTVILMLEIVLTELAIYYGAFSAMFGTTGAAIQMQAARMRNKPDNNDNNNNEN